MRHGFAVLVLAALTASAAADEGPASVVAPFYADPGSELDPANFGSFGGAALAVLEESDRRADDGGCIGFSFAIDGQDFDESELAGTLTLTEDASGDEGGVLATFDLFGEPREVAWSLKRLDGGWKVVDVEGDGWRLSELGCER